MKAFLASIALVAACHGAPASQPPVTPRIESGYVDIDGGRLFYEVTGSGSPVILLHAGNVDRQMWDDQFIAFSREHRVLRYDLRGYGKSAPETGPYEAHVDLHALLQSVGFARPSLVGLSGGGRIAIDFALAYPEMVDRLVFVAPGLSGWQFASDDTSWFAEGRAMRDRGDSVGIAVAWANHSFYTHLAMTYPAVAEKMRKIAGDNANHWMNRIRHGETERGVKPPALGRTNAIRAPTLLIVGDRDVPDILHIAETLAATVPGIRRQTFPGVGHFVNMERPAEFNRVVLNFLRQ
ncbi:MAG TPA: alpha/beta hydrolase [Gemmatimonadaceae bacterium]|nr:alpha/beta hydrolase [Gemmatimonadaceae bacterium]